MFKVCLKQNPLTISEFIGLLVRQAAAESRDTLSGELLDAYLDLQAELVLEGLYSVEASQP